MRHGELLASASGLAEAITLTLPATPSPAFAYQETDLLSRYQLAGCFLSPAATQAAGDPAKALMSATLVSRLGGRGQTRGMSSSMRASLQGVHKAFQPAVSTTSRRPRTFSCAARHVLAMAALKKVLVPIGTGSEEIEAVSALSRRPIGERHTPILFTSLQPQLQPHRR